ncbi:hypothetical protein PIB30_077413 [Stylosanthes scabra]|uniref:Uncharacterized protein n=1 Tax=Stylosanthes scabra TaxID=79078 RepID=A0ABU6VP17_9FABA|nr:hypothetical protein [Stylosanthes scabra]
MLQDSVFGDLNEERWGDWLKAKQVGRRLSEENENNNPNPPKVDALLKTNAQRPTPVSLLGGFAKLSVHDGDCDLAHSYASSNLRHFNMSTKTTHSLKTNGKGDTISEENSLKDLCDNEILAITYNGRSLEGGVGDVLEEGKTLFYFGQHPTNVTANKKRTPLKRLARRK